MKGGGGGMALCFVLSIYVRYTFSSHHNVHKSLCGLCFWGPDPLIDRFYYYLSIKGSGAQKQRTYNLL